MQMFNDLCAEKFVIYLFVGLAWRDKKGLLRDNLRDIETDVRKS